ncbi:transmembrane protein [Ditylenchus destructor]|nr:transmembrane protein [Ditylenchus destructor]
MTSMFQKPSHQRNHSQAQQLIPSGSTYDPSGLEESGCASTASPYSSAVIEPAPLVEPKTTTDSRRQSSNGHGAGGTSAMRFSTLSDCSSYYGLPGTRTENETRYLCNNPYIRANLRVVIGSAALTLVGAALLIFGLLVMLIPNDMDIHGWIFLVVGVLFFIPGVYHVTFILCVLCGRPGYSFDNLPTFTKPAY